MKNELEFLLHRAVKEITSLRDENSILHAKVHTMEVFAAALGFKVGNQTLGEDIVWRIEKALQTTADKRTEKGEK